MRATFVSLSDGSSSLCFSHSLALPDPTPDAAFRETWTFIRDHALSLAHTSTQVLCHELPKERVWVVPSGSVKQLSEQQRQAMLKPLRSGATAEVKILPNNPCARPPPGPQIRRPDSFPKWVEEAKLSVAEQIKLETGLKEASMCSAIRLLLRSLLT